MDATNTPPFIDFAALAQVVLFKGLPETALEEICRQGQVRKAEKGSFFFAQGDRADRQYLLLSGRIKLTQINAEGQQALLRAIGPYNLFGAVVLAQVDEYPVSAEAQEDCTALGWNSGQPDAVCYSLSNLRF